MRREQIDRKKLPGKRHLTEVLPIDPRDQDVVRAKQLLERATPPRRRAA